MAFDLMEMVKGAIGKQVMGQIGGIIGADEASTSRAVDSAVPAILGGLLKKASSKDGAKELFGLLDKVDGSMLGNLGSMLSGGKQGSLIEMGTKLLPMLFGSNFSSILATLAKLTGLGSDKVGSLLGLLVPIVLGVLGKQKKASGLDVSGFTNLLMSQKKLLAGLDPGLSQQLGIGDLVSAGKSAMNTASQSVQRGARSAQQTASGGASLFKFLLPLLAILALGFLVWKYVLSPGAAQVDVPKMTVPDVSIPEMPNVTQLTSQLTTMFGDTTKALEEIKDESGATKAVEAIDGLMGKLDLLGLDKLPAAAKAPIGTMIGDFITKLRGMIETAYSIPGVRPILEPVVNGLMEKLQPFAGA